MKHKNLGKLEAKVTCGLNTFRAHLATSKSEWATCKNCLRILNKSSREDL